MDNWRRFFPPPSFLGVLFAAIFSGVAFGPNEDSAFGIHGALVIYYYITNTSLIVYPAIAHTLPLLLLVLDSTPGFIATTVGWALLSGTENLFGTVY